MNKQNGHETLIFSDISLVKPCSSSFFTLGLSPTTLRILWTVSTSDAIRLHALNVSNMVFMQLMFFLYLKLPSISSISSYLTRSFPTCPCGFSCVWSAVCSCVCAVVLYTASSMWGFPMGNHVIGGLSGAYLCISHRVVFLLLKLFESTFKSKAFTIEILPITQIKGQLILFPLSALLVHEGTPLSF